jgi:hypothetical protein
MDILQNQIIYPLLTEFTMLLPTFFVWIFLWTIDLISFVEIMKNLEMKYFLNIFCKTITMDFLVVKIHMFLIMSI